MKRRFVSLLATGITAVIACVSFPLSVSAAYDINGGYHSYHHTVVNTYTKDSFSSGTGWKSKKVGDLVRTNSSTGNSFDAGEVTAYYNYNIAFNDKAYTAITSELYNCYYDGFVNSDGSTKYSQTIYGNDVTTPTLTGIKTNNDVVYRGYVYW